MSRKRLSTRERAQCFSDAGGFCHICGGKIQPGERWEISHPTPLAAGGDDVPENRRPAHFKCHAVQTATIDAPLIAKTRRQHQKHIGAKVSKYPSRWPPKGSRPMRRTTERRT